MLATTRVSVLRGTEENNLGDEVESAAVAPFLGDLPASIVERERVVYDPNSGTPRTVRFLRCRMPVATVDDDGNRVDVILQRDDRIRDNRTGIVYTLSERMLAPHTIGGGMARLTVDLVAP